MAELVQFGPRITVFTTRVTHAWPRVMEAAGCSLSNWLGITHETAGSVPRAAASKNPDDGAIAESSWSSCTVTKSGSGLNTGGVPCTKGSSRGQLWTPSGQSGGVPGAM